MATQKIIFAYWDVRGIGEPIRTLLEHLEVPYEYKEYTTDEQWLEKKNDKSMAFPNLPYLVDGEKSITESDAILTHICLKANHPEMRGKSEDKVEYLQLKGIIRDILSKIVGHCNESKNHDELKERVENYMASEGPFKFAGLEKIIGKREWVLGYLTCLDFVLAEAFERFGDLDREVGTKITTNYPNLQAHVKRFLELPNIKTYRQSNRFKARPHNSDSAAWY
jgi:glutathione S-transferase